MLTPEINDKDGIIVEAYQLRVSYSPAEFENILPGRPSFGRKIRENIYLLARFHGALLTFLRAAERIEGFDKLQLRWVELSSLTKTMCPKKKPSSMHALTVGQAFKSLGLPFTDEQTKKTMHSLSSRDRLVTRFNKLRAADNNIHAEIQLILDLLRRGIPFSEVFKYIGCSKRNCLLCSKFIDSVGSFISRGCHGKVYELWTLPDLGGLSESHMDLISSTVKKIEKSCRKILLEYGEDPRPHIKESTIGGSSIATVTPYRDNPRVAGMIANHLRANREYMNVGSSSKRSASPEHAPFSDEGPPEFESLGTHETEGDCQICYTRTSRRCTLCNRGWYCSSLCQSQMGIHHIFYCNARPINTADYLYRDCLADRLPEDPEVLEEFGFNRCKTMYERTHLFGLYIGLFIHLDVPSERVDAWRRDKSLLQNIAREYEKIPETSRGKYFPWVLRNKHILDQNVSTTKEESSASAYLDRVFQVAAPRLDGEDAGKTIEQLEPFDKRRCFVFFAFSMDSTSPSPLDSTLDMWYDFGFPACIKPNRDLSLEGIKHAEGRLGSLYNTLLWGYR
ncbi:uncharacterized protein F4822DRAFT_360825 [Hypoxylon trugodes]|uniref:uncharacterized protein n=1 Tax=Hypoxylon trugodes TaxID=326681 RepID=UPI00219E4850|nr:uncharacterized protein F4822DRAFT_360825 [Hypoxylon trugodes]KAI1386036.1 hypothetical protein F4822DRAFT_360825 [Hypoxylon trugodes]